VNEEPREDRRVSRFLLASSQFARTTGRVKVGAFLPPADGRLSVFDTTRADEAAIWILGRTHVAMPRKKTLHGRADLDVNVVLDGGLRIDDAPPPPEHANVTGWPADDGAQEAVALHLTERARLVLNPSV
jgi:hypothetical protein